MPFLPIPAIDLMEGEVVRLRRGEARAKTVYSRDPVEVARRFERAGARRLHVVDLDGAFSGRPGNRAAVAAIREAVAVELEVGGGLRREADLEALFALGADFAILGTSAIADRAFVRRALDRFGPRIIIGLDAREGRVAVEGWTRSAPLTQAELARDLEALGARAVIATDIASDGMMTGPNLAGLRALAEATAMEVIASGGVRHLEDLRAIRDLGAPNVIGAIAGRAVYEGALDLAEAVRALARE